MSKVVFLYSGEGTKNGDSSLELIKTSPYWKRIDEILNSKLSLSLEKFWHEEKGSHRCPNSPLLTVAAGICLTDIWGSWGYKPDVVIGHSVGELTAAFQAGLYSLEEILLLSYEIGRVAENLDGSMFHGLLTDEQIDQLDVTLSSLNFTHKSKKHVTISCINEEVEGFVEHYPEFLKMKPPHPWHHKNYEHFADNLPFFPPAAGSEVLFVSGVTSQFESTLLEDHWQKWLTRPIDFISSMKAIEEKFSKDHLDIVEIGFHPVLEQCCKVFASYSYASSMYRGEDEKKWILFQRKKLNQTPFIYRLSDEIERFHPGLDYKTALAYQGFSSLKFVEFTSIIESYFPGLAPQDFYRYKSVQELIDRFGAESPKATIARSYGRKNEVVISGMSCKFPSTAASPSQFWDMLKRGEDQVRAESERGDYMAGFLGPEISRFDHRYFNISEVEAKTMDPQQILALELTELLFRDAGLDPKTLNRKRTGVYIGVWNEEFRGNRDSVYYPTGTNPSIIASRISYHYDLRGPSWVANTACSSSLLAIHYACKDIEAGRVDYAIAGGVNMLLGNNFTHSMMDSGFLAADGRCRTFDDSASGYVRAEGGGLVLLVNKQLVQNYYAEILGSSVNQNGGLPQVITAPHPEAQEELILDACRDAAIAPQDITYVECHGTGTRIGDPIEISAIQNTIAGNRESTCYIGSVKSNMGHLESAAGIAGLIKSALALNKGVIPGNLHFEKPNRFIDFNSYNLQVVSKEIPIDGEALVGVSSFGFGGANAHVIIKGAKKTLRKPLQDLKSPFDSERAAPVTSYFQLDRSVTGSATVQEPEDAAGSQARRDVRTVIGQVFFNLTGITEIDPDVDLTDQGLDSLSATEFVSTLEKELGIELDADLLFDNPFIDQLADSLQSSLPTEESDSTGDIPDRREIAELVAGIFYRLTNIKEIDPDVELTDQGLDSLSATQFILQLESELKIAIDTDVLFEYPLYEQLVDEIQASVNC